MCDRICEHKIKFEVQKICDEILTKQNKNYVFGKKVEIIKKNDFEENYCKKCKFYQKN